MVKLGTWPEDRYSLSWMTQRLANRAPEYTVARRSPASMLQQVINPAGLELQRVNQQLTEERNNIFLTSANIELLDNLSYLDLGVGMSFQTTEAVDGTFEYVVPRVYGTLNDIEYELTIAKNNDINSLAYTALPSRIEDGETTYVYEEVIPRMSVSSLVETEPASLVLEGHLYISIFNNTTWEYRGVQNIYYPKVVINGKTRKGTKVTESIPIRYNGTFKTINQWQSITEIFVSYMDDAAEIVVEVLPFSQESFSDSHNLVVNTNGVESFRFVRLNNKSFGSTILSEGFSAPDLATIQLGFDAKEIEYEIELLDENDLNINANAVVLNNNIKYLYAIDDNYLYVYNIDIPYPDVTVLQNESTNTKMNMYSDYNKWIYARNDVAVINTDNMDVSSIPWKYRWILLDPNGVTWYLGQDGSKWPPTIDAWIENNKWEEGYWDEKRLELLLDITGTYVLTLECMYNNTTSQLNDVTTLTTRQILYVPTIKPETTLELPDELKNSIDIMFDSDDILWLKNSSNEIKRLNVFHDYFLVDYDRNTVWFREEYSKARVVV